MKTDTYTKAVLTVIATCLTINVIKSFDFIPQSYAAETTSKISENNSGVINSTMDVRIVDIATYDALNVNLKGVDTSEEVNVNIKSIETSDELDVNIDEVGGGWVSHGGPIKITTEQ